MTQPWSRPFQQCWDERFVPVIPAKPRQPCYDSGPAHQVPRPSILWCLVRKHPVPVISAKPRQPWYDSGPTHQVPHSSIPCCQVHEHPVPVISANLLQLNQTAWENGAHWVLLLKVSKKQGVQKLAFFEGASAVSAGQEGPSGTEYLAVASVSGLKRDSVTLQYINTRGGTVVGKDVAVPRGATDRLAPGSVAPGLRSVAVGTFQMKDNSDGFRALLVWGDERISLVQQGVTVWVRDEYLAGVQVS
ncbi:hypothetical protein DUNSADRAFT_4933 [Dunaliella salina]|uniref:EMC1 first beta-propeller domain-containing protein n=1 Tax=Dunaliella salina TaxID=3046 RepID=A0ABQ7FUJ4_DUNSA|nr:hypothetical protein DUNSADRAFT_4933 [Dunaliella salina]|eukprot:KAF5826084.1 hypothetical protein DUNSADRAFT_4933 [Dunaliella salina]